MTVPKGRFVVLTGFGQIHLQTTSALLQQKDFLDFVIASAGIHLNRESRLRKIAVLDRAANRTYGLDDCQVFRLYLPEFIYQVSRLLRNGRWKKLREFLVAFSFDLYSWMARRIIESRCAEGTTVLYRAGFGRFLSTSKFKFVCDASLAHPQALPFLIQHQSLGIVPFSELDPVGKRIVNDIESSDVCLVNSEFVASTLQFCGVEMKKVVVAYLPLDDLFRDILIEKMKIGGDRIGFKKPVQVLFAGSLELRKGVRELIALGRALEDSGLSAELMLVGVWNDEVKHLKTIAQSIKTIKHSGFLSRSDFIDALMAADIFVFPSYAEGSARAVAEAMACGLPVVVTPNSGSQVENGKTGLLIPAGRTDLLIESVFKLIAEPSEGIRLGSAARKVIMKHTFSDDYLSAIIKILE